MGYIKSGSTVNLVASLTYKGRKNLLYSVNDTDSKIVSFTISDNDVNYGIAENLSLLTSVYDIPANGFIPDFTGDYESCIKATNIGVDENINKPFILQNLIPQITTYVWDSLSYTCLTGTIQNTVLYGLHNTGNALYKNITKLINGIVDKTYNISVPVNLVGDNLKTWLADKNNTKAIIDDNNLNSLINTRILNNPAYCLLDIDFALTADQISTFIDNDCFIIIGSIIGGNGKYKVSIDNGLTFFNVTGSTYTFYNLPENQTRSIIVEDTQVTPFMSKKSVITPLPQQSSVPTIPTYNIGFKVTSQIGSVENYGYIYNANYKLDYGGMPNNIPLTLNLESIINAFSKSNSSANVGAGTYKIMVNNNIVYEKTLNGLSINNTDGVLQSDDNSSLILKSLIDDVTIFVSLVDDGTGEIHGKITTNKSSYPIETRVKITSVSTTTPNIVITHSGDAYVKFIADSTTHVITFDPYYNYPNNTYDPSQF